MLRVLTLAFLALAPVAMAQKLTYPAAPKGDQVDDFHGTMVADPFRALENPDSPETKAWIEAENKLTHSYLSQIPERAAIQARLTKLWNYERYSTPYKKGKRYFFRKNDGLQNQSVLYVADSLNGKPRMLLDPNKLSKDGTVALGDFVISDDGKLMAYSIQEAGSDWLTWKLRSVDTGKDLPDIIRWSKFSGASWTKDGKGFFYSRYDEPKAGQELQGSNYFHKLYYHRVGEPQSKDALVYERRDHKEWGFDGNVTDDGRYLIINVWQGSDPRNQIFYKDLSAKNSQVIELFTGFDAAHGFIGNLGTKFYFTSDKKAPMTKIEVVDVAKGKTPAVVVPETDSSLVSASLVGGKIFAQYLKDAHTVVKVYLPSGKHERDISFPGLGSASGFGGEVKDTETFYTYTSFTTPATVYRYDIRSGKSTVWKRPKVDFDPARYETKQVFYRSKDGTRIPMFITYRKGIKLDGSNPTLLTGYGGFRSSSTPYFSVINTVWMEMGGIFALANLRGGGEYGQKWHESGRLKNKQNVFDDFIAAAEYLINAKYTSTPKLAINGASNGGLLVGAVLNQRPDLFGAAVPEVGVMDMLRFHKFTIGWAWTSDYGSPDDPEMFKVLYKYSPYHNIRDGVHYPPTLVMTADHDDRVVPGHSFKYTARLQEAQAGDAPILIRIETRAGHGGGKPTAKIIEEIADKYGFLVKALGMRVTFKP
jgi:prolyl oligopeptidase